jgi:hypothetical protein
MKTISIEVFGYAELASRAKERAAEKLREWATDHAWWESVYDDTDTIASLMGITLDRETRRGARASAMPAISFSGFSCQGDGASFVGSFAATTGAAAAVADYAPTDATLAAIATRVDQLVATFGSELRARITRESRRYSHENTVGIEVYTLDADGDEAAVVLAVEEELSEILRSFMRWIYRQLEAQYDHLTSDESLTEMADANNYLFDEDGRLVRESARITKAGVTEEVL